MYKVYPTIACVVCKNDYRKLNTIESYTMKSSELSIVDFYCIFVLTEMNLIAFLGPSNCVNTQPYLELCYNKNKKQVYMLLIIKCLYHVIIC